MIPKIVAVLSSNQNVTTHVRSMLGFVEFPACMVSGANCTQLKQGMTDSDVCFVGLLDLTSIHPLELGKFFREARKIKAFRKVPWVAVIDASFDDDLKRGLQFDYDVQAFFLPTDLRVEFYRYLVAKEDPRLQEERVQIDRLSKKLASACAGSSRQEMQTTAERIDEVFGVTHVAAQVAKGIVYLKAGHLEEAHGIAKLLMREQGRSPHALHFASQVAMRQGQTTLAMSLLQTLETISPGNIERMIDIGNIMLASSNFDGATKQAVEVLKLIPDAPEAHDLVARTLNAEFATQSISPLALIKSSDDIYEVITFYNNAAIFMARQGRSDRAHELYRIARDAARESGKSEWLTKLCFNDGLAYEREQRFGEARAAYFAALEATPGHEKSRSRLAKMDKQPPAWGELIVTIAPDAEHGEGCVKPVPEKFSAQVTSTPTANVAPVLCDSSALVTTPLPVASSLQEKEIQPLTEEAIKNAKVIQEVCTASGRNRTVLLVGSTRFDVTGSYNTEKEKFENVPEEILRSPFGLGLLGRFFDLTIAPEGASALDLLTASQADSEFMKPDAMTEAEAEFAEELKTAV